MAEEKKNLPVEETVDLPEIIEEEIIEEEVETEVEAEVEAEVPERPAEKAKKDSKKKSGGLWKKLKKLVSDTVNEMKKVRWTSKDELKKSTVLVVVTVVVVALALGLIDSLFSWIFTSIAELV